MSVKSGSNVAIGVQENFSEKFGNFERLTKVCLGRRKMYLVHKYCDLHSIHWSRSEFIVFDIHIYIWVMNYKLR